MYLFDMIEEMFYEIVLVIDFVVEIKGLFVVGFGGDICLVFILFGKVMDCVGVIGFVGK